MKDEGTNDPAADITLGTEAGGVWIGGYAALGPARDEVERWTVAAFRYMHTDGRAVIYPLNIDQAQATLAKFESLLGGSGPARPRTAGERLLAEKLAKKRASVSKIGLHLTFDKSQDGVWIGTPSAFERDVEDGVVAIVAFKSVAFEDVVAIQISHAELEALAARLALVLRTHLASN